MVRKVFVAEGAIFWEGGEGGGDVGACLGTGVDIYSSRGGGVEMGEGRAGQVGFHTRVCLICFWFVRNNG